MYTDAADANKRKMFYFPDRTTHDIFALYRFSPTKRIRATLQMNVANFLDTNRVLYLINSSNGTSAMPSGSTPPANFRSPQA